MRMSVVGSVWRFMVTVNTVSCISFAAIVVAVTFTRRNLFLRVDVTYARTRTHTLFSYYILGHKFSNCFHNHNNFRLKFKKTSSFYDCTVEDVE